jgi:hypothetical protein
MVDRFADGSETVNVVYQQMINRTHASFYAYKAYLKTEDKIG